VFYSDAYNNGNSAFSYEANREEPYSAGYAAGGAEGNGCLECGMGMRFEDKDETENDLCKDCDGSDCEEEEMQQSYNCGACDRDYCRTCTENQE